MMRSSLCFLAILVVCRGSSLGRDIKPLRSFPSITNSLVNLGKMEISFHIPSPYRPNDGLMSKNEFVHSGSPFNIPKGEPQMGLESCPCSSFNNLKTPFLNNPTDMINKILRSNDLFEPVESSACCNSHEHEGNIVLELTPKNYDGFSSVSSMNSPNTLIQPGVMPIFSLLSETFQPKTQGLNSESSLIQPSVISSLPLLFESVQSIYPKPSIATPHGKKPAKEVEIFFFPKNSAGPIDLYSKPITSPLDKKAIKTPHGKTFQKSAPQKNVNKGEIKIVGGNKEIKTDFKNNSNLQTKDTQMSIEKKLEKARQEYKERKALNEMKEMEKPLETEEKKMEKRPKIKINEEKDEGDTFTPAATFGPPNVL